LPMTSNTNAYSELCDFEVSILDRVSNFGANYRLLDELRPDNEDISIFLCKLRSALEKMLESGLIAEFSASNAGSDTNYYELTLEGLRFWEESYSIDWRFFSHHRQYWDEYDCQVTELIFANEEHAICAKSAISEVIELNLGNVSSKIMNINEMDLYNNLHNQPVWAVAIKLEREIERTYDIFDTFDACGVSRLLGSLSQKFKQVDQDRT
jgi:hypothetical protein